MEVYKQRNHIDVVLGVDSRVLSNGDILYGNIDSEIEGDSLIVSPDGARLVSEGYNLGQLLDESHEPDFFKKAKYSGIYGVVMRTDLERLGYNEKIEVAVKGIGFRYFDTSGVEQFNAMRSLSNIGVKCVTPLIATKLRLITQWVEGQNPYGSSAAEESYRVYLEELESKVSALKNAGKWEEKWRVEHNPSNYVIGDLSAHNPIDRFIAIDPVAIHSAIEN